MDTTLGRQVLREAEQMMEAARWRIPDDFLQKSHFDRVVRDLEWNSSPGYPYCLNTPTNRILFSAGEEGVPDPSALEQVYLLVQERLADRTSDPVRLFIKPEPHSIRKLEQGRYRLISSVSVVDQIIDHMLFGDMNEVMIKNHVFLPTKPGWVPYVGGWKFVPMRKMVSCDKSAWDWTVKPWLIECELELRIRLCENMTPEWKELAIWRYERLFFENTFVTSGGLFLKQKQPGVMKSGCVNTITSNSLMQVLLHLRVAHERGVHLGEFWAMGDDVMQELQDDDYFELLSQYCSLKQVDRLVEFAGMRYYGSRTEPQYHGKHAFNLLHQDEKWHAETAASYALLYHRSKYRGTMRAILSQLGDLPDFETLDQIWDGR